MAAIAVYIMLYILACECELMCVLLVWICARSETGPPKSHSVLGPCIYTHRAYGRHMVTPAARSALLQRFLLRAQHTRK